MLTYIRFIMLFLLVHAVSLTAYAKFTYIPSHLNHFNKTGECDGCDLSEANLCWSVHNSANLHMALLVKSNLSYSDFYTSNFSSAQMMYSFLYSIKASGSNFTSTNLTGSDLGYANLSSCNFAGATLTGVNLARADLARAIISSEQLASVKSLSCTIMPDGSRHASDDGKEC